MKQIWSNAEAVDHVDQVQIQMGLNFEAGGNLYITQAKGGASISVTVTLKPAR